MDDQTRQAHLDAVEALEQLIAPVVVRIVRSAMAAAVRRLNLAGPVVVAAGEQFTSLDDLAVIDSVFREGVTAELVPALHEIYTTGSLAAMIQQGEAATAAQAARAARPIAMVVDRRAVEYLARAENRLRDVGARLWSAARTSLSEGFAAGEDMTAIAGRMQSVLRVGEVRAMTIARTEVVAAANAGNLAGQQALGSAGASHKQWLATMGPRTRDTHAAADGQVVAVGEAFSVGGSALEFPGDPSGPASEVVNCRCTMLFVDGPGEVDMAGRESPLEQVDEIEEAMVADAYGVTRTDDGGFVVELPEGMPSLTVGPGHPDHAAWAAFVGAPDDEPPAGDAGGAAAPLSQLGDVAAVLARPEQIHARAIVEDAQTGDGRKFVGPIEWVDPPFAMGWQKEYDHNSVPKGAVQVGLWTRAERIEEEGRQTVHLWGHFDEGGVDGAEAARQVREGTLRWMSIDPDDILGADVEEIWPDDPDALEPELVVFHGGRLRGGTLCPISALVDANVEWIGEGAQPEIPPDEPMPVPEPAVVAAALESLDARRWAMTAAAITDVAVGDRVRWFEGDDIEHVGTIVAVLPDSSMVEIQPDEGGAPVLVDVAQVEIAAVEPAPEDDGDSVAGFTAAAPVDPLAPDVEPAPAEGVIAAGLALVAQDTGRVLLLQRSLEDDDPASGRWEFPGGKLDEGETPLDAARREFAEEVGVPAPDGEPVGEWTSPDGVYQGFVVSVPDESTVVCNADAEDRQALNPDDPDGDNIEVCAWWSVADLPDMPALREEVRSTPWDVFDEPVVEAVERVALVAASHMLEIPDVPPAEWFDEPDADEVLGALTITDEGRVFGYLAPGGVGHLAPQYRGRTAPIDADLTRFLRGETIVAGGHRVVTGSLTMGCGHASVFGRKPGDQRSLDHYDNTCSLFARVNAGINRNGHTWVAGALFPDVQPGQVARAMASQCSGDWQPKAGGRGTELIAGLLVPVPGFAMARRRASVTYRDGALVASAVPVRFDAAAQRRARLEQVAERIASSIGRGRDVRAAELAARVHGGV